MKQTPKNLKIGRLGAAGSSECAAAMRFKASLTAVDEIAGMLNAEIFSLSGSHLRQEISLQEGFLGRFWVTRRIPRQSQALVSTQE